MNDTSDHKAVQARRKAEREARRRAELMANMARRKAQIRGRAAVDDPSAGEDQAENSNE